MILKILILEDFEQSGIFESWSKTCPLTAVRALIGAAVVTFLKWWLL